MFPVVTVSGSPYERGAQYGSQARERVQRSIASYADLFRDVAGWDWRRATAEGRRFLPAIEDFAPQYVEELAGIAAGAEVAREDVLAINVRTEILNAARVKTALAMPVPAECTAFASVSADSQVLVGQNWDWVPFARDTMVILQVQPDDGPSFVTGVEAGLLAKFGVNSAGLAVMTNALACAEDSGDVGVPYHAMLRALLECSTTAEAVALLGKCTRASSANYLLADVSGSIVDVEARPGNGERLHRLEPDEEGVLLHTNHFIASDFDSVDYADLVVSTSQTRLKRAQELFAGRDQGATAGQDRRDRAEAVLTDHTHFPDSICRHPDRSLPLAEQTETVASVLIDVTEASTRLSEGPPCESGYQRLAR
jgi:isopenicillin-N N-acyltransferase-like protein